MRLRDLTGQRFGRLVVTNRASLPGRHVHWKCICDCGALTEVEASALSGGATKSCGCLRDELTRKRSITHGHSVNRTCSREYRAWSHAKSRCECPTDPKFPIYGGRGIRMCHEWAASFQAFYNYMGPAPIGHTIDRINPNDDYAPGNVRWANSHQQARTRTGNIWVCVGGEKMILKDAALALGVNYKSLHYHYRRNGLPFSEAAKIAYPTP